MKKQPLNEEFKRMQKLAGLINENTMSDDDIIYNIFVEGPTFTTSQGGGHPFYDADLSDIIKNGGGEIGDSKFKVDGDYITMVTEFDPYDYVNKKDFDSWWERNNKNNEFVADTDETEVAIEGKLIFKDGKWFIEDKTKLDNID